jgi:putative peptidoglycan lipid II flippase
MSNQKTAAKAAGFLMAAILLSRILGLIRGMVVAHQFGQGDLSGAYAAAFTVPDLIYFFLSGGALSSAFMPVFVQYLTSGKEKEAWKIFSTVACFMTISLTVVIVLAEFFTYPLVGIFAYGFRGNPSLMNTTISLTRIVLPAQIFFFLGGLMIATLEARQRFTARAVCPLIYNIGIIFGGLVLTRFIHTNRGVAGLAWGALGGAFLGNLLLTYASLRRAGYSFVPNLNLRHPGVIQVGKLALPVMLGLSLPQIDVIINRTFSSSLGGSAVAAITFSNMMMQVPLGVFAQAAAAAFYPTMVAHAARREIPELKSSMSFALRGILFLTIPASVFMMVLALPIIRTVYQSGQFRPSDAPITATALLFYSAGIFAWAGQSIVSRGFYALQDTLTVIVIGTIMTAIFIPMNYGLMQIMGLKGLPLATSIAATLHMIVLMLALRKRIGSLGINRIVSSVAQMCVASGGVAGVCWLTLTILRHHVNVDSRFGSLQVVLAAMIPSFIVYIGLMRLMRSQELRYFVSMIAERRKRSDGKAEPESSVTQIESMSPHMPDE